MKTLVGMVSIGKETAMRRLAVKRARIYASNHGYEFLLVEQPLYPQSSRTPHWEKTLIPLVAPGYERYLIIDDDILVNHRIAPALPEIERRNIGLVREPLPGPFIPTVDWVGNTGYMLLRDESIDLMAKSYERGECKEIVPGFGDQPAINLIAWSEKRVTKIEWNWNYLIMADWFLKFFRLSYPWPANKSLARLGKVTLTLRLLASFWPGSSNGVLQSLRRSYAVHLTSYRMGARLIDRILG